MKVASVIFAGLITVSSAHAESVATKIMLKMSDTERNAALTRLLLTSGEKCDAVYRSMFQGGRRDTGDFWSAACKNGRSFLISVKYDSGGSTKIASCSVMKAVGVECFKKL